MAVGFVVGAVFHEGGHAVCAALVGITPRVVNIGIGRPIVRLRLGRTWLVLRICPLAAGWIVLEPSDRRWARVAMVAGGPLSNLMLLSLLYLVTLIVPSAYDTLEPIGFVQAGAVVLTLFPMSQRVDGVSAPRDGFHLIRLLFLPQRIDLAAHYAKLLRTIGPSAEVSHPLTRHAGEILYQASRRDRWIEPWAKLDAIADVGRLLQASDLTASERAYLLTFLMIDTLVAAKPAASPSEIAIRDGGLVIRGASPRIWSQVRVCKCIELVPECPLKRLMNFFFFQDERAFIHKLSLFVRGAVLVERGDLEEGQALLTDALQDFETRGTLFSVDAMLGSCLSWPRQGSRSSRMGCRR